MKFRSVVSVRPLSIFALRISRSPSATRRRWSQYASLQPSLDFVIADGSSEAIPLGDTLSLRCNETCRSGGWLDKVFKSGFTLTVASPGADVWSGVVSLISTPASDRRCCLYRSRESKSGDDEDAESLSVDIVFR